MSQYKDSAEAETHTETRTNYEEGRLNNISHNINKEISSQNNSGNENQQQTSNNNNNNVEKKEEDVSISGNWLQRTDNDFHNPEKLPSPSEGGGNDKQGFWGPRETLTLLSFLGMLNIYAMRTNLSVAIVAMVRSNATTGDSIDEDPACPFPEGSENSTATEAGEFDWDTQRQGLVLGSFYYGYFFTNLLGGRLAEMFGGRLIFGAGVMATGVLTIISPFAAMVSSEFFIAIRVLEGMAEGFAMPAINVLLANWTLPGERAKYGSYIYSGMQFGTVISLVASGWLCSSDLGWPSAFYVFGALAVVWAGFWFMLVKNTPAEHSGASPQLLSHLSSLKDNSTLGNKKIPVRSIVTSLPVWGIVVIHFGYNWGFYTLLTELPTYLDQIQHFSLASNGLLSAMPYAAMWLVSIVYGSIIHRLTLAGKISILNVRRMSMAFAGYIPMLTLIAMCFVNCDRTLAMVVLTLSVASCGSIYAGVLVNHADLAPRYAATLMGISNTVATIPGFLSPLVVGILTKDNQSLSAWRVVFIISAVIYVISTTFYLATASASIQPWNYYGMDCTEKTIAVDEKNKNREKGDQKGE